MSHLQIIKASAGSGKTFSLTGEYLKIIIDEPLEYYKHILAVTFTNKATAEMKSRILEELYLLGSGADSHQLKYLMKETGKDELTIRDKSRAILNFILHGYSWFRVETIDSFFQGVIRSFIHELGIPGIQNVEIDANLILDEAVDRFLENLGINPQITEWLLEYIEQKISESKNWLIKNELKNIGLHLFKEKIKEHYYNLEDSLDNKSVKEFSSILYSIKNKFETSILSLSEKAINAIENQGHSIEDFAFGKSGVAGYLYKLHNKVFEIPGKRVIEVISDPEKWVTKKSTNRVLLLSFAEQNLQSILISINEEFEANSRTYFTSIAILKNFHLLGILFKLSKELRELQKEKNIFLISDAAPFIYRIINNNDAPFIYEKIGNRFNHLLIDEFQDTSSMQWRNFSPLISNSLSMGYGCLLVGDIKQSIYRWRNSNWEILAHGVKEQFDSNIVKEKNLEENYRSDANIIEFNNKLFSKLPEIVQQITQNSYDDFFPLESVYADVEQKIPEKRQKNEGYIKIKFFDKKLVKDDDTYFHEDVFSFINRMLEKGFSPGNIAILVRTKAEGATLAKTMVDANKENKFIKEVGVISNESLFLNGSGSVKLLLAALKYVFNPSDKLAAASVITRYCNLFNNNSELPVVYPSGIFNTADVNKFITADFTEKCRQLRMENLYLLTVKLISLLGLDKFETEKVYIHSFLDLVFNYCTSELSDLSGFLKFWEDEGAKKAISASDSDTSVRILTIHKSKGLEFPIVIIPFADWDITPKSNEILWVESNCPPFDTYELLPVNITKSLDDTHFSNDYQLECYRSLIDNLNLLYVAFTRPKSALFVISRISEGAKNTMGDLISTSAIELFNDKNLNIIFNAETKTYEIPGTLVVQSYSNSVQTSPVGSDAQSTQIPPVRINYQSSGFIREKNNLLDPKSFGKILHLAMEGIKSSSDIDSSVLSLVLQGIISTTESAQIKNILKNAMENKKTKAWFSGGYTILNEADIIGSAGNIKRPDRIMIKDDTAIVVDYKFGKEGDMGKHQNQVKQYMRLMSEMQFSSVKGFLWYVMENDVEEVFV